MTDYDQWATLHRDEARTLAQRAADESSEMLADHARTHALLAIEARLAMIAEALAAPRRRGTTGWGDVGG